MLFELKVNKGTVLPLFFNIAPTLYFSTTNSVAMKKDVGLKIHMGQMNFYGQIS